MPEFVRPDFTVPNRVPFATFASAALDCGVECEAGGGRGNAAMIGVAQSGAIPGTVGWVAV